MASIVKQGNYWAVAYRVDGNQRRWNTGIRSFPELRNKAEKRFKDKFGSFNRRKNTQEKAEIYFDSKKRAQIEQQEQTKLSILANKFLLTKTNSTRKGYKRDIKYLIDLTNDIHMGSLTLNHIEKLESHLNMGTRTINGVKRIFRGIRAFINYTIKHDELNQFSNLVRISMNMSNFSNQTKKDKYHFRPNEYKLLKSFIKQNKNSDFELLYIDFALQLGVRLSECLSGSISPSGEGYAWKFIGKGNKEHIRHLSNEEAHQWLMLQESLKKDSDGIPDEFDRLRVAMKMSKQFSRACKRLKLFLSPQFLKTKNLNPQDVYRLSIAKANKLGKQCLLWNYAYEHNKSIRNLSDQEKAEAMTYIWNFHSLRHTWNTEMAKDIDISKVSRIIGHSSEKITKGYIHLSQYEQDRKYRKRILN